MDDIYSVVRVSLLSFFRLFQVENILYKCGKNMAEKENLHHWDNPHIKNILIVIYCFLKNQVYLVYKGNTAVATFQTRVIGEKLLCQKIAVNPENQGQGLATFCYSKMENIALENNCSSLISKIYENNEHSMQIHMHYGFKVLKKEKTLKHTLVVIGRSLR